MCICEYQTVEADKLTFDMMGEEEIGLIVFPAQSVQRRNSARRH